MTLSLGLSCLCLAGGFVNYCLWGLRESIINGGAGHFQIYKKGFKESGGDDTYHYLIGNYKHYIRKFSRIPGIKFIAPRLSFTGLISSADRSTVIMGHGGWTEEEKSLTAFSTIDKGGFISEKELFRVLLGGGAANLASLDAGDPCTISVTLNGGGINAMDFSVSGILRNQLEEMENVYALIPLDTAQKLLNVSNSADTLIIMLAKTESAIAAEKEINKICEDNGLEYRRWDQIVPYYQGASEFYSSAMNVALAVILVIVIFAVANTMLMSMFERIREIGTMRSLGTSGLQVIKLFASESLLLAAAGGILGIGLAYLFSSLINGLGGIPLPPPPGNSKSYKGLIFLSGIDIAVDYIIFLCVSAAASLYPSFKAIRISIADSLRWI